VIDIEDQLRSSLQRYAGSVQPSPPELDANTIAVRAAPRTTVARRRVMVAAAAAVLLLAVGLLAWASGREADGPYLPPAPPSKGSWTTVPVAPLSQRKDASVVWTGKEFIVFGGNPNDTARQLTDGAAYNPTTVTWRRIAEHSFSRVHTRAVWAGDRMVVLDGNGGAAYDPATDAWSDLPTFDVSSLGGIGADDVAVANGQVLAFARVFSGPTDLASGAASTTVQVWALSQTHDSWESDGPQTLADDGSETFNRRDPIIATDDGFVVWGSPQAWRYRLGQGWTQLPPVSTPNVGDSHAVWMNGHLIAIGSIALKPRMWVQTLTDTDWSPLTDLGIGGPLSFQTAAAGDRVVVLAFGGLGVPVSVDPVAGRAVAMTGFPLQTVDGQAVVWSGTRLFVWGGQTVRSATSTGSGVSVAVAAGGPGDTSDLTNSGALWTP
jgi:hypothetical protein